MSQLFGYNHDDSSHWETDFHSWLTIAFAANPAVGFNWLFDGCELYAKTPPPPPRVYYVMCLMCLLGMIITLFIIKSLDGDASANCSRYQVLFPFFNSNIKWISWAAINTEFVDLALQVTADMTEGKHDSSGLILGLHPANVRRRYKVTPSLIGWAQTLESAL